MISFCAILAGVFVGIGVALILRSDASSGGFDTLALIIHIKTGWRLSILVNIFDALILSIQFLYATPTHIIYGFVMIVASTLTLDRALRKAKRAVQLTIISHQAEAIRDYVFIRDMQEQLPFMEKQAIPMLLARQCLRSAT